MEKIERRSIRSAVLEERAAGKAVIRGLAAVYFDGSPATEFGLWDGAVERFLPGSLEPAEDVLATFNHSESLLLGRSSSGTLRLELDEKGLRYEIDPGDTSIARDVREHIRRGDVSGSSIGFVALEDGWRREADRNVREIRKARVFELGPVVEPAYAATSAEARAVGSLEQARESLERSGEERRGRILAEYRGRFGSMFGRVERRRRELERSDRRVSRGVERIQERRCAAQHLGLWDCEPRWLQAAVDLWRADRWPALRVGPPEDEEAGDGDELLEDVRISAGVAEIEIRGQITKRASSLGGASSLRLRRQIRRLTDERPDVRGIWLRIDSPGGTASGTDDLAAEIRRCRLRGKRVEAYVEDLCASAAYWAASQAERITAGPTAEIGSIGTFALVFDASKAYARQGIQVHLVATGPQKGAGAPGVPITSDQLRVLRREVEDHFAHFAGAVARGRGVLPSVVRERWASGECWIAERARELGLIDQVEREEEALARFRHSLSQEA